MCIRDRYDVEAHHKLAQKVAEGSMTLLKNEENILPLKSGQKAVSYTHLDVYKRQAHNERYGHFPVPYPGNRNGIC